MATAIVGAVVLGIAVLAGRSLWKDKQKGTCGCGGSCGNCAGCNHRSR